MTKILVVRMLEMGDVASIALPAIRYIKQATPNAEVYCLTHAQGHELIASLEPDIQLLGLENGIWPDNIFQGLEAFLGIAESVIEIKFDQIINLDTAFMPCFLVRFLKDAGEPVQGNYIGLSLQELIDKIQNQTLQPAYVNDVQQYMQSTFFGMFKWHTQWWQSDVLCDHGYPEFYLKNCCGFNEINYDPVLIQPPVETKKTNNNRAYLGLNDPHMPYLHTESLIAELKKRGFDVVVDDENASITSRLNALSNSDVAISFANAVFALAKCVGARTVLIPKQLDPRILMPDFALDMSGEPPLPEDLADSIASIFEEPLQ